MMDKDIVFIRCYAVISWLFAAWFLYLAGGLAMYKQTIGMDLINSSTVPPEFTIAVLYLMAGFMLTLAVIVSITGAGLWRFRGWSRYVAIILAAISVFMFPYGTIIGAGGLYLFGFDRRVKERFTTAPTVPK